MYNSEHTVGVGAELSHPTIIHNPTNTQQNTGYIIFSKHITRFIHCVISVNTPRRRGWFISPVHHS